jgi:hypothetical protein
MNAKAAYPVCGWSSFARLVAACLVRTRSGGTHTTTQRVVSCTYCVVSLSGDAPPQPGDSSEA